MLMLGKLLRWLGLGLVSLIPVGVVVGIILESQNQPQPERYYRVEFFQQGKVVREWKARGQIRFYSGAPNRGWRFRDADTGEDVVVSDGVLVTTPLPDSSK